jgi:hypothetical protein
MRKNRHEPAQIPALLRQIERDIAKGKTTVQACRAAQITARTFYRWRKELDRVRLDQARRLKKLEKENVKLKELAAKLLLRNRF